MNSSGGIMKLPADWKKNQPSQNRCNTLYLIAFISDVTYVTYVTLKSVGNFERLDDVRCGDEWHGSMTIAMGNSPVQRRAPCTEIGNKSSNIGRFACWKPWFWGAPIQRNENILIYLPPPNSKTAFWEDFYGFSARYTWWSVQWDLPPTPVFWKKRT